MPSPVKLSHAILKTYQIEAMRDWYSRFLGARVVIYRPGLSCFLTYDEEHHRIGFLQLKGEPPKKLPQHAGLMHIGWTFESARSLLTQYARLRDQGTMPVMCTNHGPTFSMYYKDPDGNAMELLVDRFATAKEADDFMQSDLFKANGLGIGFDPEALVQKMDAGATEEELMEYDPANLDHDFKSAVQKMREVMNSD